MATAPLIVLRPDVQAVVERALTRAGANVVVARVLDAAVAVQVLQRVHAEMRFAFSMPADADTEDGVSHGLSACSQWHGLHVRDRSVYALCFETAATCYVSIGFTQ